VLKASVDQNETAKLYVKHPGHRRWSRGAGGCQAPLNFWNL